MDDSGSEVLNFAVLALTLHFVFAYWVAAIASKLSGPYMGRGGTPWQFTKLVATSLVIWQDMLSRVASSAVRQSLYWGWLGWAFLYAVVAALNIQLHGAARYVVIFHLGLTATTGLIGKVYYHWYNWWIRRKCNL
jgi:hypothetical protein